MDAPHVEEEPALSRDCQWRIAARVRRKPPSRWMARTRRQSASAKSVMGAMCWMPALLTATSSRPSARAASATPRSTCSSEVTSIGERQGAPAALLDGAGHRAGRVEVDVGHRHRGALAGEPLGHRPAQPAATARHQHPPVRRVASRCLLSPASAERQAREFCPQAEGRGACPARARGRSGATGARRRSLRLRSAMSRAFLPGGRSMKRCVLAMSRWCSPAWRLAQEPDWSKVEVKVVPVAGGVSMLVGQGGNIGVTTGKDGTFLIDDQFAPLLPKIRAAVKTLGDGPIRFVVNTHFHGDHTGSNALLGEAGAVIVAHDNVRKRLGMERVNPDDQGADAAEAARSAWPLVTFADSVTLSPERRRARRHPRRAGAHRRGLDHPLPEGERHPHGRHLLQRELPLHRRGQRRLDRRNHRRGRPRAVA